MNIPFYKKIRSKIIVNTREFIFNLNDKFPLIGRPLATGWYILRDLKFVIKKEILKLATRLKYNTDKLDFDKIYWIHPHKIQYCLGGKFDIWKNYGKILGGDWDQSLINFEDLDIYQAFKQRFKEGRKWEETEFYHRVLGQISNGIKKWDCKNKKDFDSRLERIDSLYYQIKDSGYKSQQDIYLSEGWLARRGKIGEILDEIAVVIDRNGQFLLVEGRHRLSIAKLLNIPQVPIRIIARHKKWMDFRKELIFFSKNYQKGKLYQPLTHPDLQDIPFQRDGEERFKIIKKNLTAQKGTLLDIGANLGYFCHKFEEGFDCYALEENQMCLYFLERLKKAENRKFKIIPETLFEYKKNQEISFDVVLALSIFHHFLDRKDTYLNLIKLLKRLKTRELFFEAYLPSEFRNKKFYQSYTPEQFVDFIINNSCCLNKAKLIGKSEKGRLIYKFVT